MARARRLLLAAAALALVAAAASAGTASPTAACKRIAPPPPRPAAHLGPPRRRLDPARRWLATVTTNCGPFSILLDVRHSPKTTASFAALARRGYFDRTVFHRIVPGFVIQGGDPTQSGAGGPGYTTVERPPPALRYVRGVVAMAKTPAEAAGTAGSQFFVVTAADARLPPVYAVLGRVVKGDAVAAAIGRLGNPATEQPTEPIVISRLRVAAG